MELRIKKLNQQQLHLLVEWARREGWNPGPDDASAFFSADPEGHYGYFEDEKMIAGGSLISYQGQFGFMGLFIVDPDYRGKGIGRKLWYERRNLLINRLQPGSPIGMDGVVAMQPFYEKGGFKTAFRDERYMRKAEVFEIQPNVSKVLPEDYSHILRYDRHCFGFERELFMRSWIALPGLKALKYVSEGELGGFVLMRKADKGFKICPLFAQNEKIAESLYLACLSLVPGEDVFIDIPVSNQKAVALTQRMGAQYVFECARMYYGTAPSLPLDQIFGITTFELG